jgi:glycosyltransferase involved in cell wall biosynthesis
VINISIVIPALNEEHFLPHLLTSLTKQTKSDFEVIVVDGSSTDRTVEVARSFGTKLPKLEVIVSQKASLPLQRNLGARALPFRTLSKGSSASLKNEVPRFLHPGFDRIVRYREMRSLL